MPDAPVRPRPTAALRARPPGRVRRGAAARPIDPAGLVRATDDAEWRELEPSGLYVRCGRPLLDVSILACTLAPAALCALVIAAVNWVVFRDVRRILYVQPRVGRRGRTFSIYKFRTMRESSQGELHSWSHGEDQLRVTAFGRILRNTHLDELPQILNVLRGDMSLIGPRPEMVEIHAWATEHVPGFRARLALKPGITGLAQITQGYTSRDVAAYARKLEIDERYRRSVSLGTDLAILVRTVLWMLRGRGWQWKSRAAKAA